MPKGRTRWSFLLGAVVATLARFPGDAAAEEPGATDMGPPPDLSDSEIGESVEFEAINLRDLLDMVVTATGAVQSTQQAPAIITVIGRDDIERAGYRSLAEALDSVSGLALNTDHVFSNVGVRGISGGIRGGSRHIKFLINGHAVAFRPDAQNLIGPEFIPLSAIQQIEIIRGPASALYGVNAFLGVINIITRAPRSVRRGATVELEGGVLAGSGKTARGDAQGLTGGGAAQVAFARKNVGVLFSLRSAREDRSHLSLPSSSPNYADFGTNTRSERDRSRPLSGFFSLRYAGGALGQLSLESGLQQIDADAEYGDTGALSHDSRINVRNYFGWLGHVLDGERWDLRSYVAWATGGPGSKDVVHPVVDGRPTSQLVRRRFEFTSVTGAVEPRVSFLSESSFMLGAEYDVDRERLRQNIFVSPTTRAELPSFDFGTRTFSNFGGYAQLVVREIERLDLSSNLRWDHSNQFGSRLNYRGGAVWTITDSFYAKLLSGSSYRAPSPEQLYGSSIEPGGVQGARSASSPVELLPQRATTNEILLGLSAEDLNVTINAYRTKVIDRIEYLPEAGNLQVANLADSVTIGGELEARGRRHDLWQLLKVDVAASTAIQRTNFEVTNIVIPRKEELLHINELYPPWDLKLRLNVEIPRYYLNVNARVVAYGRRAESQTNQRIGRPFVGDPIRYIGVSFPFSFTVSSTGLQLFGDRMTTIRFQVQDAFETASDEPGFNGINVPSLGRRVFVTLVQEL